MPRIRARAARQDDSAIVILIIILLAITVSFVAIAGLLGEAKAAPHKVLNLALSAATIILSWTVTQVVFTLHYAHEYYRPSGGPRAFAEGLDFRGDRNPVVCSRSWSLLAGGSRASSVPATARTRQMKFSQRLISCLVTP